MSQVDSHSLKVRYGTAPAGEGLSICTDSERGEAQLSAEVSHPAVFRDALLTLADVLAADTLYVEPLSTPHGAPLRVVSPSQ